MVYVGENMETQSRNTAATIALHKLLFSTQPELDIALLKREYLERDVHLDIYDGIVKSIKNRKECNVHYLLPKMQTDDNFKEEMKMILSEENDLPDSIATMKKVCHMLHEHHIKNVSQDLLEDCKDGLKYENKTIHEAIDDLTSLANRQPIWEEEPSFGDVIIEAIECATKTKESAGFETHLKEWQTKIGSFCPAEVHTISGFPSAGKSALTLNIVWNMAKNGVKVRYISLEETRNKLMNRVLANESGVPITAFKYGLNGKQTEQVVKCAHSIKNVPFTVDTKSKSLSDIMATCAEQKREKGLDVVVIDPVSYIEFSPEPSEFEKANKIGLFALQIAQKLECCVLLVAHVNNMALGKDAKGNENKPSQRNVYGGQGLIKPSFSVIELRRASKVPPAVGAPIPIDGCILKVRDNVPNQTMHFNFYGEHMNFTDRIES